MAIPSAPINIITTCTSVWDWNFHASDTNPKPTVGDLIIKKEKFTPLSTDAMLDPDRAIVVDQSQFAQLAVLSKFFNTNFNLLMSFSVTDIDLIFNGQSITIINDTGNSDLLKQVTFGQLGYDTINKKLFAVCYNKSAMPPVALGEVIEQPFSVSIYKSSNVPSDYLDAYDILKPYVPIIDQAIESQGQSRAIDDGSKITFFADKYLEKNFVY